MGDEVQALLQGGDFSSQRSSQQQQLAAATDDDDVSNQGFDTSSEQTFDADRFFQSWQNSIKPEPHVAAAAGGRAGQGDHVQQATVADLQLSESDSDQDFQDVT